jgi:four helix bundle protein
MRRSAVSIPSNIVEGSARYTPLDFLHFLDIAYGSAKELQYQASLATRLDFLKETSPMTPACKEVAKTLNGLIQSLRKPTR